MDMKIGILFKLKDGAIIGNNKGDVGYMSKDLCDSDIDKLRVIKAHESSYVFRAPLDTGMPPATETIELNKGVVPTPDGLYVIRCGYGNVSETWIIQGVPTKVPLTSDRT